MMKARPIFLLASLLGLSACAASPLALEGAVMPGGLMVGEAKGAQLFLDGVRLKSEEDGSFAFGFGRDSGGKIFTLEAHYPSGEIARRVFRLPMRDYVVQRIDGLADNQINPPPEVWGRIRAESSAKRQARGKTVAGSWFHQEFAWPVAGTITGTYGTGRILNGEPKRPHGGIDIAAPKGTPVLAPAGGVVVLAEKDFYFEGGLVFLNHGGEVMSAFLHLDALAVKEGEQIARGALIGEVGASGRATGAHLDWRLYWRDVVVDPALVARTP